MYLNLNEQQQFRLNEINETKDYFIAESHKRKWMSKRLSKCTASLNYALKRKSIIKLLCLLEVN